MATIKKNVNFHTFGLSSKNIIKILNFFCHNFQTTKKKNATTTLKGNIKK